MRLAVDQLGRGVQVYIDALDVLVEDYASPSRGIKIIKTVLQSLRAQKGTFPRRHHTHHSQPPQRPPASSSRSHHPPLSSTPS